MHRRTVGMSATAAFLNALLNAVVDAAPLAELLAATQVRLFTGAHVPGRATVLADLPQATFIGYAANAAPAWSANGNAPDGMTTVCQSIFTAGAIVATEIITGYYLCLTAGPNTVWLAERFAEPVQFAVVGDQLELDVVFEVPNVFRNSLTLPDVG